MKRFILLSALIILVFLASLSLAGIPKMINYQGMLTDDLGDPLSGPHNLTFRIYDDTTGGELEWSETQNGVQVENGLFNVILGRVDPLDLAFDEQYWLEVQVGDTDTMPRLRFTSVGYAYRAERADTASYALSSPSGPGDYTWTFRITDTADTTLMTGSRWGIARYGNVLHGNADSTHVNLGVACTTGTSGQGYKWCTIGGGVGNTASEYYATVGGGNGNNASRWGTTVAGGNANTASGGYATVAGGFYNTASGHHATVAGGYHNTADGNYATVGGGYHNTASGLYATVGGGYYDTASGDYSFAAGRRAKANHTGAFVWADGTDADFASSGSNQFLIRASGGVGIGTNDPSERLHVEDATGDNAIKVRSASACTSSLKLFEGSDYGFEFAYCGNDDKLHLWSRKFSGNEYIRMTWLKNGNVGIGTTDPAHKLDVEGYIQAYGYYTGDIIFQKEKKKLWRMFEDEDGLYLENLKTGKIYRFVLQEVKKE